MTQKFQRMTNIVKREKNIAKPNPIIAYVEEKLMFNKGTAITNPIS